MLHLDDDIIKSKMLSGMFGLEKENLRVLSDGSLSHTPHPMPGDKHIVRDFSENQIEINTSPHDTVRGAMEELAGHEERLKEKLASMSEHEYLWPFSNPPYLSGDEDIPIAKFEGEEASKTTYREHLSEVYGRHKMTFSGIHVNYSFDYELIEREAELEGAFAGQGTQAPESSGSAEKEDALRAFKDGFYVDLAAKMSVYGWLLVVLTAASPMVDGSFYDADRKGETVATFAASLRCSKDGYWNFFDPVLDYNDINKYAASIERYVDDGTIDASTELYYPVRLKPSGMYDVRKLAESGADHIELRMFDLDPLIPEGLDSRDVEFARLLMLYLASQERVIPTEENQIDAIRNFKEAAKYDLSDAVLVMGGSEYSILEKAEEILEGMLGFFEDLDEDQEDSDAPSPSEIINYELGKIRDDNKRYAVKVEKEYGSDFVGKTLEELL